MQLLISCRGECGWGDWLPLYISAACPVFKFLYRLPFGVRGSAFGVWRLAFGVPYRARSRPPNFAPSSETPEGYVGQAVLETLALSMRRAIRPAPGGEPLYPVASPGRKSGGNKSGITRQRCQQAAPENVPSVMFRLYVLYRGRTNKCCEKPISPPSSPNPHSAISIFVFPLRLCVLGRRS
jgi:hypothetical protein